MVEKKPKIVVELLPGAEKKRRRRKTKVTKVTEEEGLSIEDIIDKRLYVAERCDDKDIPVEAGEIYYGREIDTSESEKDVLAILERKGEL